MYCKINMPNHSRPYNKAKHDFLLGQKVVIRYSWQYFYDFSIRKRTISPTFALRSRTPNNMGFFYGNYKYAAFYVFCMALYRYAQW